MPKIDVDSIPQQRGADYPAPFDQPVATRVRQRLGDAAGLTQFGVNRLALAPGCWSAQRHWHSKEDEFIFVVSGELVLVTDDGEQALRAGDCAAFPAGAANGHHLVNRSDAVAVCLEVGSRDGGDVVIYPDIGMVFDQASGGYARKDGAP